MLKLSKLTDYGLLAAVYLARHGGRTIAAREVAEFYSLPLPVVSKVLKTLHEHELIESRRGVGGGYAFTKDSEEVTLEALIEAFEGPWNLLDCESIDDAGDALCAIRSCCPSRTFIGGINRTIKDAFQRVTLGALVRGAEPRIIAASTGGPATAREKTI